MRRALLGAAAALMLAGCGTTLDIPQNQAAGVQSVPSSGDLGLNVPTTVPQTTGGGPSTSSGGSGASTSPTSQPIGTGGGSPTPSQAVNQPTASRGRSSATPTATATANHTPIRVGLLYPKLNGAAAAIGLAGLSTGDTLAQADAVVRWVNAHGGAGGHPIQLLSYAIEASTSGDPTTAYQAACAALTQDDHVRYVISILGLVPGTMACFARAGVGVLDDESGLTAAEYSDYSAFFAGPGDFSQARLTTELVNDLWRRGWLTSKSKVGAFSYDDPGDEAIVSGPLTQALRAHGLRIAAAAAVPNTSQAITQAGSVVLRFRTAGVDRVIPVNASPLFLMISASTQGYRPAYAMTSLYGPGALIESSAPKDQLVNSAGIGWQPMLDIGRGKQPPPVSPNETLCFKLMQGAGQASSSKTVRGFEAQVCDLVFYFKAMGDAVPSLPSNLIASARQIIGSSYRPADTFRSDMRQHPDGVAAYRDLAYEPSCSCYQYVSGIRRTTS